MSCDPPVGFWNPDELDFDDPLNREIWDRSPEIQLTIQSPESLRVPGSYGPQQAMIEDKHRHVLQGRPCLPWVPDLFGSNWRESGKLLVVGAAYAGFIREYSTRGRSMPISDAANPDMEAFQRAFLRDVVQGDSDYYGPIAKLVAPFTPLSSVLVTDLARVSLVRRGTGPPHRRGDLSKICGKAGNPTVFARYAEAEISQRWLWRRIERPTVRCIIALGFTSEHGLLRFFRRNGCVVRTTDDPHHEWRHETMNWPCAYARMQLSHWIQNDGNWWIIDSCDRSRTWHILPVYHPSVYAQRDRDYVGGRRALIRMFGL